jgi:hypothetical protein
MSEKRLPKSLLAPSRGCALLLGAALALPALACDRAAEKLGRVGETASRQVGRSLTDVKNQGDEALDEPFERVQEAADERLTNAGDSIGDATAGAIDSGYATAEQAARGVAAAARFGSADASDEFDSVWADKPDAAD